MTSDFLKGLAALDDQWQGELAEAIRNGEDDEVAYVRIRDEFKKKFDALRILHTPNETKLGAEASPLPTK